MHENRHPGSPTALEAQQIAMAELPSPRLVYRSFSLLNTASFVYQSWYTSLTLRQSTTLQNRFKYHSLPHTPKPALIHACSWTLKHMSGLRSSPALRRSLTMPSCLLELVPPSMRSLDVLFHRGSGGAEGSSKSASSSSVPVLGVYCDDGVRRSPRRRKSGCGHGAVLF